MKYTCKNLDCFETVPDKRWHKGYHICLDCGEEEAQEKIKVKSKQNAPAYNKGAYQYITSLKMCKDIGR